MSGDASTPTISLRERSIESDEGQEKLPKSLVVSLLLHGILIVGLFFMPHWPTRTIIPPPVYTVDLVGGERIGGSNLGTELLATPEPKQKSPASAPEPPAPPSKPKNESTVEPPPPPPPAKPKKEPKAEPPPPAPEIKKQAKKEMVEKPAKAQKEKVEEKTPLQEKIAAKEVTKKAAAKKETASATAKEAAAEAKTEEASLERVRERLIQSAVERVKSRTEAAQKTSKEETISAGTGEGLGSASLGSGGPGGGGVVKGIEFIAYQNQMLSTIKANWAWVGQNSNLRVVVQFFIRENGDVIGLKIVQPSGDPSYDESVLRAVTKSSPLPPPPESYRKEFSEIKITFRPRDLGA